MQRIDFEHDGYEIVVDILNVGKGEQILEANVYYKNFERYSIYILASNVENLISLAISELLGNHPFEKMILNYDLCY